jgi:hypothetical protein
MSARPPVHVTRGPARMSRAFTDYLLTVVAVEVEVEAEFYAGSGMDDLIGFRCLRLLFLVRVLLLLRLLWTE